MKDLSLHILDIVQNSIAAGAGLIQVDVLEDTPGNTCRISITDNGRGMTAGQLEKVRDPYFTSRTTRKVGMGIPLFEQTARQAGGRLMIESLPGSGTKVMAVMEHDHIDRPELGDMPGVISMLAGSYPEKDFEYRHEKDGVSFCFRTSDIKEILGDVPLSELGVIRFMKQMIMEEFGTISSHKKNS